MAVTPSTLRRLPDDGSPVFSPYACDTPSLAEHDYVQEEWVASGVENGHTYETTLCVRRPRDAARCSGTVIVETLHVHGIAPVWLYTGEYIVRSGHTWVCVTAQKFTLDMHVKGSNPTRYAAMHIDGPDTADFDPTPRLDQPDTAEFFWAECERRARAAGTILAQVGAALRAPGGPVVNAGAAHIILAGHSQTGSVASYYLRDVHHVQRLADGSSIYDGFFPTGFPFEAYRNVGVPVVHVMSEGDVSRPDFAFRPMYAGRRYRRDDSDKDGDQYRLYELAGIAHMGTRVAPYNDTSLWTATFPDQDRVAFGQRMNSLPHFEMFNMCLHHLVQWVVYGSVPPRADRLTLGDDGFFASDEHGNTRGGVRCAQMDVPHTHYLANPLGADGRPSYVTVGVDEPFAAATLQRLYGDRATYVERFNTRLDELIAHGWFLSGDAPAMRAEAQQIDF